MFCYKLRKDNLFQKDIGNYSAYGIDVFEGSSASPLRSVTDISFDKDSLEDLLTLCNELQLDITHLDDVIEDFLS